jgi:hypothetical protein
MPKEKKLTDKYITSQLPEPEKGWTLKARETLKGQVCVGGRYITKEEAKAFEWSNRPFALFFESGLIVYAVSDDEGNQGGALFTSDENLPLIPVMLDA